jgi:hypothetical protein
MDKPDWRNSCQPELGKLYVYDPIAFEAQCRILTQRFAQKSTPPKAHFEIGYWEIQQFLSEVRCREFRERNGIAFALEREESVSYFSMAMSMIRRNLTAGDVFTLILIMIIPVCWVLMKTLEVTGGAAQVALRVR